MKKRKKGNKKSAIARIRANNRRVLNKDEEIVVEIEIEDKIGWRDYILFGQLFVGIAAGGYKAYKWWRNRGGDDDNPNRHSNPFRFPIHTPWHYHNSMAYMATYQSTLMFSIGLGRCGII